MRVSGSLRTGIMRAYISTITGELEEIACYFSLFLLRPRVGVVFLLIEYNVALRVGYRIRKQPPR